MNKSDLKLIAVLERTGGFASAQELHQILRREGDGIGLTTVYRALQSLVDDKIVDLLRREDGEAIYRLCGDTHHHHLVCKSCGDTVEIEGGAIEKWAKTMAEEFGFREVGHTAQGIFINFDQVMTTSRKKPPFGIGQIGKSFRNEITPGNFIFRTREFEQMEMEFFVVPGTDEEWHQYWIDTRMAWYTGLGINPDRLRIYDHPKEKLSHYSKRTADIEYKFEFAGTEWGELEGIANRTDFDLKAHSAASGKDLSYFDQEKGERWTPYVIEPAAGVDRCTLTFLMDAFTEDEAPNSKGEMEKRAVLKLDHRLAPIKVAVLPLSRNADLSPKARDLAAQLRKNWAIDFDDSGAIGRRYRRQDEIGTPYCITIDFETLEDHAVTIRDRDTMAQERIALDQVEAWLAPRLLGC